MALTIIDLQVRPAEQDADDALTNEQKDELLRSTRSFIQAKWNEGWRGAGSMGDLSFGERKVRVVCMALQHMNHDVNEGYFIATYD